MISNEHVLHLDGKVSPNKLADVFGVNVSLMYQEKQKGAFGNPTVPFPEQTYREVFRAFRTYHNQNTEVKIAKLKLDKERAEEALKLRKEIKGKNVSVIENDSEVNLQVKQMEQRIRLDRVKEVQTWLAIAQSKNELLQQEELYRLYIPFIQLIKTKLVALSLDFPDIRESIEKTLEDLANFGRQIMEGADTDNKRFLEVMLEKDISDDLQELKFIPELRYE